MVIVPAANGPMKGMVLGRMHYIRSGDGSEELYALELDPEQETNLAGYAEAQEALQEFRGALRSMLRRRPLPSTPGEVGRGRRFLRSRLDPKSGKL